MKLSKLSILTSALATTAFAAPAVVTVTEHAHNAAVVTVQGVVYVENGQILTTYKTFAPTSAAKPTSTATAVIAPPIASASASASGSSGSNAALSALQDLANVWGKTTDSTTTLTPSTSPSQSQPQATATASPTVTATTSQAAATSASASDDELSDFASSVLAEHNKKRALHKDTPALTWSNTLATYAQDYADNYDCSGTLTHSGGPYGENLALGYDGTSAVDAWYNEISSYDFSNPGFSGNTGHFTQVVWKSTTQVGCGIKTCGGAWGDYVICSYDPAGNYEGEYADNVEPLA